MAYSQIRRTLTLLNLLHAGRHTDVKSLARTLGCSTRTVFRDIKLLNDNNVHVRFDEALGGYTIDTHLPVLPELMGEEELAGLLAVAILSPLSRQGPAGGISHPGLVKMMQRISTRTRGRVSRMVAAIVPPPGPVAMDARQSRHFDKLVQAIADRHRVKIHWTESPEGAQRSALLSPYQLRVQDGQWAVLGWSSAQGQVTELRLSDLCSVTLTERPYRVPIRFLRQSKTPRQRSREAAAAKPAGRRSLDALPQAAGPPAERGAGPAARRGAPHPPTASRPPADEHVVSGFVVGADVR